MTPSSPTLSALESIRQATSPNTHPECAHRAHATPGRCFEERPRGSSKRLKQHAAGDVASVARQSLARILGCVIVRSSQFGIAHGPQWRPPDTYTLNTCTDQAGLIFGLAWASAYRRAPQLARGGLRQRPAHGACCYQVTPPGTRARARTCRLERPGGTMGTLT